MKVFVICLCLGVAVIITDCSTGTVSYRRARVTGRHYSPESTIYIWNGGDLDEIEIPESWKLYFTDSLGKIWTVSTDKVSFDSILDGYESVVKVTKGKSGFTYATSLDPSKVPDDELAFEK